MSGKNNNNQNQYKMADKRSKEYIVIKNKKNLAHDNNDKIKSIKRENFDPEYYCSRYFMHNLKSPQEAIEHWEKEGYYKNYLISVCDELKTHDHCLCICKIKNDNQENNNQNNDTETDLIDIDIIKADTISNSSDDIITFDAESKSKISESKLNKHDKNSKKYRSSTLELIKLDCEEKLSRKDKNNNEQTSILDMEINDSDDINKLKKEIENINSIIYEIKKLDQDRKKQKNNNNKSTHGMEKNQDELEKSILSDIQKDNKDQSINSKKKNQDELEKSILSDIQKDNKEKNYNYFPSSTMDSFIKKKYNEKDKKIKDLENKISMFSQYSCQQYASFGGFPMYSQPIIINGNQSTNIPNTSNTPNTPNTPNTMSQIMSNTQNHMNIEKIKQEFKDLKNDDDINDNIFFEYNIDIIVHNMKQADGILDHMKMYLSNLIEYIKKCIDILIIISPPTTPSLIYNSSRNSIVIYLAEYDKTIINATYNDIHLFYHHRLENTTPIKFAIFMCPDKKIEKEIINCIKEEDIYLTIQPPFIDLHSLDLDKYIAEPLFKNEVMTTDTNPFPPSGFGCFPDYYSKLNPRLKKNWDFRIHLNKFNEAINKINLEIEKVNTYKNSLCIKKRTFREYKY